MSAICCNNCDSPMPDTGHRACADCRATWRQYGRKPGGPAEQKEALIELVAAAKDVTRMLEAVRYSSGLGQGQITRLKNAHTVIAKAEGVLHS